MKKMVLIPYEQFTRSNHFDKQNITKEESFKSENSTINPVSFNPQLMDSDSEESVGLPHSNTTSIDSNNSIVTVDVSKDKNKHTTSQMTDENILVPFSKKQQNAAKALLHYAKQHLSWNTHGELICNNDLIHGSHITDLLKDALAQHKKYPPLGYIVFYGSLKGVPLSLIHNKDRKHLIGKGFATQSIPPPGLPINQKPKDIAFSDFTFLSKWQNK